MLLEHWKNKGYHTKVLHRDIFIIDTGGNKPVLAILHGYPTSSFDYYKVLDILAQDYRVILHDHLGFGFSDKPANYSYSLIEQTDVAIALWKQLGIAHLSVLAHDYGTSIATELLARKEQASLPFTITRLILCNGSMHIELAKLRPIQKLLKNKHLGPWVAKLGTKALFSRNLKQIYYDSVQLTQEEIDVLWEIITYKNGRAALPRLSNYINERYFFWHRWIGALRSTDTPIGVVWAKNDPIAVMAIAEQLRSEIKNCEWYLISETGHFPMLENPKIWVNQVKSALKNDKI